MDPPSEPALVNAAWLESFLRCAGGFPAATVGGVRAETIGAEFGFMGIVARLHLEGGGGVPPTLVAKWCAAEHAERETLVHRAIGGRIPAHLAALHGAVACGDGRAVLVSADVSPARQGDCITGGGPVEAHALAGVIATVHAAFWNSADDPAIAAIPRAGERIRDEAPRTRAAIEPFLARRGETLPAPVHARIHGLPDRIPGARAELARAPATLLHADLHMDNVLFGPDGTPVLLDWANAARGAAALDFMRLIVEVLTPGDRPEHEREVGTRYLGALAAAGVSDYDAEALWRHTAHALELALAATIRWAVLVDADPAARPRVRAVVDAQVRNVADAFAARI